MLGLSRAQAWESFPEFESLTEQEESAFDRPSLLGPRYQSGVLAYSKPPEWEYEWLAHDLAFDTSVGSISSVNFLTDTRAKIHSALNDWVQFRFTAFDERNFDRQSMHSILELVFRPVCGAAHHLGLSVYGEPSFYKREDDVGAALLWWPSPDHELRLFNTWVDVTRQKRSDLPDTFVGDALPYARGLVGRLRFRRESFLEYAARYETKTQWHFPDQKYDYRFWRELASLYYSNRINDRWRYTARLQADRKFEARDPQSVDSPIAPASWTTDRLLVNVEAKAYGLGPRGSFALTTGLEWAHRRWSTPFDTLIYNDWLPHLILERGPWSFDYKFALHRKVGGGLIDHPTDKDDVRTQRLDIVYSIAFSQTAELRLDFGFNLDALGTTDTWAGGDAQFRWALP